MSLLQIVLSVLFAIDLLISWYSVVKKIDLRDDYFEFQKKYGIKSFTVIKVLLGLFSIATLPGPSVALEGPELFVLCYAIIIILLCNNFFIALRRR